MSATVEIKSSSSKGGLDAFIRKLKKQKEYLLTGFFTSEQASIATYNEFGATINVTPKMRGFFAKNFGVYLKADTTQIVIPARPFMRTTVDRYGDAWVKQLAVLAKKYQYDMKKVFNTMGEVVMNNLKTVMQSGDFKENSAFTIAHKQGSVPLIDTGDLRDSIAYKTETE